MPWQPSSRSTQSNMLGWFYALLFGAEVYWLARTLRRKSRFGPLLLTNVASVALAGGMLWHFDHMPVTMGFAYFPEVLASLCALAAFVLLMLVTTLCWLLRQK